MLDVLVKLSELALNVADLIKSLFCPDRENIKSKDTYIIDNINIKNNININNNYYSSTQKSFSISLLIIITTIFTILTTYFYDTLSAVLFFSTLICTFLRFRAEKKYHLPEKAMTIFTARGSLYSFFAVSTFVQPVFITNLYNQLPSAEGIFSHASVLISWLVNSSKILWHYFQKEDTIISFCLVFLLALRFLVFHSLFSDIYYFCSKKALLNETENILLNQKNQLGYLLFLIVIFFIAYNPALIEKMLAPILAYLQS